MSNFTAMDCYLFGQATHYDIYKKMGAHLAERKGKKGVSYMAAEGRWVGVKSGVYCAAHHSEAVGSCLVKKTVYKNV